MLKLKIYAFGKYAIMLLLSIVLISPITSCRKDEIPGIEENDNSGNNNSSNKDVSKLPEFGKTISVNYSRGSKSDYLIVSFSIEQSRYRVSDVKATFQNTQTGSSKTVVAESTNGKDYKAEFNNLPKATGSQIKFTIELRAKNQYGTSTKKQTFTLNFEQ